MTPDIIDKIKILAVDCKAENIDLLPFGRVADEFRKREEPLDRIVDLCDEALEDDRRRRRESPAKQ